MLRQAAKKVGRRQVNFFDPEVIANPYPFFLQLRDEAAVVPMHKLFGRQVWFITRYEDATAVLKDQRFSVDWRQLLTSPFARIAMWLSGVPRFDLSRSMIGQDEPDHARLRALVSKAFTPRFIEGLRPRIQFLANDLLDKVQDHGEMDLVSEYAYPLPINVISDMLGIPEESREQIRIWSQIIAASSMARPNRRALKPMNQFADYVEKLAAEKRRNPGDDLISQLVQIEESGDRLNEEELLSMIILLIFAGHETTSNLISLGMLALFDHPDQLARLKADPGLIPLAVEEMLRYTGPVIAGAPRFAREDVEIAGHRIRKGELVLVGLASANRDSDGFPDAETMDTSRKVNKHIAFGQGIHYCLGAPLARMEGEIAFSTLLERMPDIRLKIPREEVPLRGGMSLRGLLSLPVSF